MITGRPYYGYSGGWAVLVVRNGNWPSRAHHYDVSDGNAFRALCGKHLVSITDALPYYAGTWDRCAHCQKKFDRQWN